MAPLSALANINSGIQVLCQCLSPSANTSGDAVNFMLHDIITIPKSEVRTGVISIHVLWEFKGTATGTIPRVKLCRGPIDSPTMAAVSSYQNCIRMFVDMEAGTYFLYPNGTGNSCGTSGQPVLRAALPAGDSLVFNFDSKLGNLNASATLCGYTIQNEWTVNTSGLGMGKVFDTATPDTCIFESGMDKLELTAGAGGSANLGPFPHTPPIAQCLNTSLAPSGSLTASACGQKSGLFSGVGLEQEIWTEGRVFLDIPAVTKSVTLLAMNAFARVRITSNGVSVQIGGVQYDAPSCVAFSVQQWVKVKVAAVRSTKGRVRLWINDALLVCVTDIDTSALVPDHAQWGIESAMALTAYWDALKAGALVLSPHLLSVIPSVEFPRKDMLRLQNLEEL